MLLVACGSNSSGERSGVPSPTLSSQLTAVPLSSAQIDRFELKSDARYDAQGDPKGGGAYITKQDITVRAHTSDVLRLDVVATLCGSCGPIQAYAVPDQDGNAEASLHLPETGQVYVVSAYGVLAKDDPLAKSASYDNEPVISGGSIKVKAMP